ncbi:hypothetical protein OPS25_04650 [Alteromonas ponticola]|uniref:Uncharacterized protein n=1 Tax=Alteromonas aquimaris TaxID=2998417 RepID=A0ABT3P4V1_9ALTE|nr:hypothetical protein [Alteromonas aquimaris]MCW8107787.1 hypothetical protein [Alteromonas aquimaris]
MLKAYAVALAITTSAPVASNDEGLQNAPINMKEVATETQAHKNTTKLRTTTKPGDTRR